MDPDDVYPPGAAQYRITTSTLDGRFIPKLLATSLVSYVLSPESKSFNITYATK